jgi:hypothetical protein
MIKPAFSILYPPFNKIILACAFTIVGYFTTHAQSPHEKLKHNLKNYIRQYSDEAINQMIEFKIPASVILAQAIFESGSGTSDLAVKSNNHFGIKCHVEWSGDTITQDDDTLNECFRKYMTVKESFTDHSLFLTMRPRYATLFELPTNDYKSWCYGIKNAGYATYPTYAEDLIKVIEDEKLFLLDNSVDLLNKPMAKAATLNNAVIKGSELKTTAFNLKDFSKDGVLWLDEKDVLIQSIEMILDGSDEELVVASE